MLYRLAWILFRPMVLVKACRGRERIPPRGPLVVVANHRGDIDPYVIGPFFPFAMVIHWFAKEELYDPALIFDDYFPRVGSPLLTRLLCRFVSFVVRHSSTIPVDRENSGARVNRLAVRRARRILEGGGVVGIFGEGGIARQGEVRPVFVGLAKKTGAPILPVRVSADGLTVGSPVRVGADDGENVAIARRIIEEIYRL